ncbi:MAG: GNAT family N-acetyltransferase [Clostridium sp.]|uniref:GNAT family N-acetyltransferase n=1 Tax=Clostridium sp. TaxID=1506 RepID=UPI003F321C2E
MIIREIRTEDANDYLNMLLELDKETKFMLYEPNERSNNIDPIKKMIEKNIEEENLLKVAIYNNQIVGFICVQRGSLNRIRHTAYIVLGIRKQFRGKGIGKSFFKELDLWSKENNIKRLELTVMCKNDIAKSLYEKNGFLIEGIKKKSVVVDGEYMDEFYMAKIYK